MVNGKIMQDFALLVPQGKYVFVLFKCSSVHNMYVVEFCWSTAKKFVEKLEI